MEFCRLCYLVTPLELCKDIFLDQQQQDDPTILELIAKLTDITIDENDPYSKIICPNCYVRLIGFYDFQQIILQTDLKFRRLSKNTHNNHGRKTKKSLDSPNTNDIIEIDSDNESVVEQDGISDNSSESSKIDIAEHLLITDGDSNEKNDSTINDTTPPEDSIAEMIENIQTTSRSKTHEMPAKIRRNQAENVCYICGKICKYGQFDIHLRTHTGEKPYKCNICNRQFTTRSSLKSHHRLHTGEKPYKCNYCNDTFMYSSGLSYHLKLHTDKGPHNCFICNKTFARKFCLNKHLKVHTGDRPYQCGICKKKFTRKNHLDIHSTLHSDHKPYQCGFCKRYYSHIAYLTRHQMKCTKRLKI